MSENPRTKGGDRPSVSPERMRLARLVLLAALAISILADLLVKHDPYFGMEGLFAFGAWFAVIAGLALVLLAKALGAVLQRPDEYYDA